MDDEIAESPKVGPSAGNRGKGRPKGVPNKVTSLLKDAILQAATEAGGADGLTGYLRQQAIENPGPFMTLLGKVLPMQLAGSDGEAMSVIFETIYEAPPEGR